MEKRVNGGWYEIKNEIGSDAEHPDVVFIIYFWIVCLSIFAISVHIVKDLRPVPPTPQYEHYNNSDRVF